MNKVFLHGGYRTHFHRAATQFKNVRNYELAAECLKSLVNTYANDEPNILRVMGSTVNRPETSNIARESALKAGLDPSIPDYSVSAAGTSGLIALVETTFALRSRKGSAIASAVDVMGDVPFAAPARVGHQLLSFRNARTLSKQIKALSPVLPFGWLPRLPEIKERSINKLMGKVSDEMAERFQISREEQDQYALNAHKKYFAHATQNLSFVCGTPWSIEALPDNGARKNTSLKQLRKLRPRFSREGTSTAGNSSFPTDGAAAVLLGTTPRPESVEIVDFEIIGVSNLEQDLLLGPTLAIPKLIERNSLCFSDIGVYELHEAFAAQILSVKKALTSYALRRGITPLDWNLVNKWGGSLAIGNPFSPNILRLALTAQLRMLEENREWGLVASCSGGGLGSALLLRSSARNQRPY